jgi:hypothetical protein
VPAKGAGLEEETVMRTSGRNGGGITLRRELSQDATIQLPPGRRGLVVRVERGVLLVTQEGDLDDHVLEPTQELRIPPGGLAVGWALAPATVVIADAA